MPTAVLRRIWNRASHYGEKAVKMWCASSSPAGFTTHITIVNTKLMDEAYLGRKLTAETLRSLKQDGVDLCGEKGEYHIFVSNGSLFQRPILVRLSTMEIMRCYPLSREGRSLPQ